jgi:cysteine-rich repeat protein
MLISGFGERPAGTTLAAALLALVALVTFAVPTALAVEQIFDVDETTSTFEAETIDVSFTAVLHPSGIWGTQTTTGTATVHNVIYAADGTVTLDPGAGTIALNDLSIGGMVNISGNGVMNWAGLLDLNLVYTIVEQSLNLNTPVTVPLIGGAFQAATNYEFSGISDGNVTGLINYGIGNQNFSGNGDLGFDGSVVTSGSDLLLAMDSNEPLVVMGELPTLSVDVYDCALVVIGCIFYVNTADITINSFSYNNVTVHLAGTSPDVSGPVCGDGVAEGMEACDDGNVTPGDGCDEFCQLENCGDGIVQASLGEECDDSNTASQDGCSSLCLNEFCGDTVVQAGLGEVCDDGNTISGDGCTDLCAVEFCGDNIVQAALGEACDDGNATSGDGCNSICLPEFCGDNIVQAGLGEACDDGNATSGDGCSDSCQTEICGNGTLDAGEACDDGNAVNEDGCTSACVIEACGDSIVQAGLGETCDDGNAVGEDGCSAACLVEGCGDTVLQTGLGESCDDGNVVSEDGCNAICQLEYCGDSIVQTGLGESCDDGNAASGDGCSDACLTEQPQNPLPALGQWGTLLAVLLMLSAGSFTLMRRRDEVS